MQRQSEKMKMLQDLNEAEFRQEALIPLLKKMGYKKVRERHGPREYGKDITFYEENDFGCTHYAVVAKVGDISGAASGKQNLATVQTQIDQAFNIPFEDVENKRTNCIDRVIVWTTGNISNHAEKQIVNSIDDRFKYVDFQGDEATLELLEKHYPAFFTIRDVVISDYYDAVKKHYSRLEELRILGAAEGNRKLPVIFVAPSFSEFGPRKTKRRSGIEVKRKTYSFRDIQKLSDNIILIGGAGSGKTTLLRKLFLSVIELNERDAKREPIPILTRLKKIDISMDKPIEGLLKSELSRFSPDSSWEKLQNDLDSGNVIIYLDGLDELENESSINQAIESIKNFNLKYPKIRIILTTRYLGVLEQTGILSKFRKFKINDLAPKQMIKFIENWYGQDSNTCRKLIKLISNPTNLRGLPATPMTLAIVAILHERSPWQEIPANQTELVSKDGERELGIGDVSKDISVQL